MVMDGAKAQVKGEFIKKLRECGIHVEQMEPYIPKASAAACGVREMKRGVRREQLRSNSPTFLWDYCLERQLYVRFYTGLDIFKSWKHAYLEINLIS
jgi:hypothetical protein